MQIHKYFLLPILIILPTFNGNAPNGRAGQTVFVQIKR